MGCSPLRPNDLLIPRLIVEHKEPWVEDLADGKRLDPEFGHCYMNCVSVVRFLTELDIWEEPVYGLMTRGKIGVVFSVFASRKSKNIYVVQHGPRAFDISDPVDVFHLAVILIRIGDSCKSLQNHSVFAHWRTSNPDLHISEPALKVLNMLSMPNDDVKPLLWTKAAQSKITPPAVEVPTDKKVELSPP
ncbi:hypothetical protein EUX98_g7546 [Antrodiella citrinella]|uniref:Uncharacterized protein n=1 Tax=Antrodiella citrinella TaxID=2447956 RepID=A0A4S4ML96_9APHY|nr:hypothetical protein EUX98_g7546 [Antrodiella citrinella]